ncbi:MAG: hypothetical protein R3E08_01275 [Thiotrichaceae bacterium]
MSLFIKQHSVLPGFHLALGFTLLYLSLIVLIPCPWISPPKRQRFHGRNFGQLSPNQVVMASRKYRLSFGASLIAACVNAVFGLMVAWVLVRYSFFGKKVIDALIDLPFAFPTAVAVNCTHRTLYARNGWLGQYLEAWGIKVAFTPLGVVVTLIFIGLPCRAHRTTRIGRFEAEVEEAAAKFGRNTLANLQIYHFPSTPLHY